MSEKVVHVYEDEIEGPVVIEEIIAPLPEKDRAVLLRLLETVDRERAGRWKDEAQFADLFRWIHR